MSDDLLPEQISEGDCYQIRADNGVRVYAKVHEITESGLEIPIARIRALNVRFYWRRADGKWSDNLVSLSLEALLGRRKKSPASRLYKQRAPSASGQGAWGSMRRNKFYRRNRPAPPEDEHATASHSTAEQD